MTMCHSIASGPSVTMLSLLVEEQDRSVISDVCRRNQWEAFFAGTYEEARQMSDNLKPQLILLDRDLTDADWRKAMSLFARSSGGACIMLISRVADRYLWNEVFGNGGYDVLAKPLQKDEVFRAVRLARCYWEQRRTTASTS